MDVRDPREAVPQLRRICPTLPSKKNLTYVSASQMLLSAGPAHEITAVA